MYVLLSMFYNCRCTCRSSSWRANVLEVDSGGAGGDSAASIVKATPVTSVAGRVTGHETVEEEVRGCADHMTLLSWICDCVNDILCLGLCCSSCREFCRTAGNPSRGGRVWAAHTGGSCPCDRNSAVRAYWWVSMSHMFTCRDRCHTVCSQLSQNTLGTHDTVFWWCK